MQDTTVHHVLILGCGRSGTSIFGELLEHLAPYTYYSEPAFADLQLERKPEQGGSQERDCDTAGNSQPIRIFAQSGPEHDNALR